MIDTPTRVNIRRKNASYWLKKLPYKNIKHQSRKEKNILKALVFCI